MCYLEKANAQMMSIAKLTMRKMQTQPVLNERKNLQRAKIRKDDGIPKQEDL